MSENIDLVIIGLKMIKKEGRQSNHVGEFQPHQNRQNRKKQGKAPKYVREKWKF